MVQIWSLIPLEIFDIRLSIERKVSKGIEIDKSDYSTVGIQNLFLFIPTFLGTIGFCLLVLLIEHFCAQYQDYYRDEDSTQVFFLHSGRHRENVRVKAVKIVKHQTQV